MTFGFQVWVDLLNSGKRPVNAVKSRICSGLEQQQQLLRWRQQAQVSSEYDMLGLGIIFHFIHS